jgi:hypothetical protein
MNPLFPNEDPLCLFDGFKLRTYDPGYIQRFLEPEQAAFFELKQTVNSRNVVVSYNGRFKNLSIKIHITPRGWAADISGSFHKWMNGGKHNYNDFYWRDFEMVYNEIVSTFQFDPKKVEVVNLEVGVNITLGDQIKMTVSEMLENILSLFGRCNVKTHTVKPNRDSFKVDKGERYLKMYSKTLQHKLVQQVLRMELGYKRARQIFKDFGIKTLYELKDISINEKGKILLQDAFKNLHMFQPDLLRVPQEEIMRDPEVAEYVSASFWCKLQKKDLNAYTKARKNQARLISKYCFYNLKEEVLNFLRKKLFG